MREDARLQALRAWLSAQLPAVGGGADFSLAPASTDASFRRYFRVAWRAHTWIAMDAPPPQEDCRPFVEVAALLHAAGVHVPRVLAQDLARGFLLLTDLGTRSYLAALREADEPTIDTLLRAALATLIEWQAASRDDILPAYDAALLARELALFPEWYVARHLGITWSEAERADWSRITTRLIDTALAQAKVFVHRDYMPRNLMVCEPNPGVLDFQDAVRGPLSYDVVSLFRDAFISWDEARVLDGAARYWDAARATRAAGAHGLCRLLSRLRMDGPAAPFESAGYLCAPALPRWQVRVPRGYAALHRLRPRGGDALRRACAARASARPAAGRCDGRLYILSIFGLRRAGA